MSTKANWIGWLIAGLALVGLFDASYLTANHYLGTTPVCIVAHGCDTVLTSQYATILGIPLALLGAGYYLVVFLLTIMAQSSPSRPQLAQLILALTTLGFLTSLGLVYLQLGVIHAICAYCMLSATTSTILFFSAIGYRRISK